MEIRRGCYGLPQSGILANKLLKKRLAKHGYFESPHTSGLWKHVSRLVHFTWVMNDFGIKYVGLGFRVNLIFPKPMPHFISQDDEYAGYVERMNKHSNLQTSVNDVASLHKQSIISWESTLHMQHITSFRRALKTTQAFSKTTFSLTIWQTVSVHPITQETSTKYEKLARNV